MQDRGFPEECGEKASGGGGRLPWILFLHFLRTYSLVGMALIISVPCKNYRECAELYWSTVKEMMQDSDASCVAAL